MSLTLSKPTCIPSGFVREMSGYSGSLTEMWPLILSMYPSRCQWRNVVTRCRSGHCRWESKSKDFGIHCIATPPWLSACSGVLLSSCPWLVSRTSFGRMVTGAYLSCGTEDSHEAGVVAVRQYWDKSSLGAMSSLVWGAWKMTRFDQLR